ncbi:MAG TPA: hypothetical protein PKC39_14510 [Ferruginibacter sp.]|nr:hypothetical protein [Ferruginibacter sp.]HMP22168.1 hypothetical protein [Ferruginibacter sp.]
MNLKEIVRELIKDGDEERAIVCKVTAVNGMRCECEPVNGNAPILDVRLVADEADKVFVVVPKVNSLVVVEFFNNSAGYVSMVSEVSEVLCKTGDSWYSMTDEGFLIKRGNDSLKDILSLIIQAVNKIVVLNGTNPDYAKLVQANNKLNNLMR